MTLQDLGVLVFGHRRPRSLWNVLESLRRQAVLPITNVWIDGDSHADERADKVQKCRQLAAQFPEARWTVCNGHLGIEKMMLDALTAAVLHYRFVIVLEDDCFPVADAIETFSRSLAAVQDDPTVYSVYGHPFRVPEEGERFSRFQGWGWATTRDKVVPLLAPLRELFMMSEPEYLSWTASVLTSQIRSRLDVTAGRNVTDVLARQFSWDSATALLTALRGLDHVRTPKQVIYNCGMGTESGHFFKAQPWLREPPFNLIAEEEVWQYFHGPLAEPYRGRTYFGLDELDRKVAAYLPPGEGVFVEVGANDGLNQTNTLYFERQGWRGVLVEAVEDQYRACLKNRPLARVVHAACVAPEFPQTEVDLHSVGLMSFVVGARRDRGDEDAWLARGEEVQGIIRGRCRAPARTLTRVLDEAAVTRIDFLSLDVEGYELSVLRGLNFGKYSPIHILVEESGAGEVEGYLRKKGYSVVAVLNERNFSRDILFRLST